MAQDLGDGPGTEVDMEADLVGGHSQGDILGRPGDTAVLVVLENGDIDELVDLAADDLGKEGLFLVLDDHAVEPAGNLLGDPLDAFLKDKNFLFGLAPDSSKISSKSTY